MAISAPTDAFAVHIGNGVVQLYVQHANYPGVKYFEVITSDALSGDYFSISNNRFTGPDGHLYGFLTGKTIYMKVRAIGVDNTISSWVQVKLGVASKQNIVMRCTGIKGSRIAAGELFTSTKEHRIFGVRSISQINFT